MDYNESKPLFTLNDESVTVNDTVKRDYKHKLQYLAQELMIQEFSVHDLNAIVELHNNNLTDLWIPDVINDMIERAFKPYMLELKHNNCLFIQLNNLCDWNFDNVRDRLDQAKNDVLNLYRNKPKSELDRGAANLIIHNTRTYDMSDCQIEEQIARLENIFSR